MTDAVASCLLIAKVLVADGIMAEPERAFLAKSMESLGLSDDEKKEVRLLDGFDEAERIVSTRTTADKRAIVDRLLEAAFADGKLSPHETTTIAALTKALGLG